MEKAKNLIIFALVVAVVVFGWILYKDHTKWTAMSDKNETERLVPDEQCDESEVVEEIPIEPEYVDNGNVYYYLKSGESLESNTEMLLCYFNDEGDLLFTTKSVSTVMQGLMDFEDYWDDFLEGDKGTKYTYSSSRSTNSKTVYTTSWDGEPYLDTSVQPSVNMITGEIDFSGMWDNLVVPHYGEHYIALSEDRGSLIRWDERKDSEEAINKAHYSRVKKAELMPQGVDLEFLYE